ncbi:hypothetical protein EYC84_011343 [Monilinia fructicola]|uniref:Glutaredoxin domain-containing protein n=1 Tax=Monilinia fructicola TaxID=38448 RepID=A0A5M9J983_MONFR|nr:hypothetical protein EYC84_011343 [Monilinia fructicola]
MFAYLYLTSTAPRHPPTKATKEPTPTKNIHPHYKHNKASRCLLSLTLRPRKNGRSIPNLCHPQPCRIINFHAPWAAPCAQMTTVLRTLALSYPPTTPDHLLGLHERRRSDCRLRCVRCNRSSLPRPHAQQHSPGNRLWQRRTKVRNAIEKHANSPNSTSTNGTSAKPVPSINPPPTSHHNDSCSFNRTRSTNAAPVMCFMKGTPSAPQCGFSRQLVALLREKSVKYGFFNILADDEVRQGLKEFADWPTFPQLWIDGELVGGLDIVKERSSK